MALEDETFILELDRRFVPTCRAKPFDSRVSRHQKTLGSLNGNSRRTSHGETSFSTAAMKAAPPLHTAARSSPRSQANKAGAHSPTVGSPLAKTSRRGNSSIKTDEPKVNDSLKRKSPRRSGKGVDSKAAIDSAETSSPKGQIITTKLETQTPISQGEDEIQVEAKVAKKASGKRKVQEELESAGSEADGGTPQSSKRKKTPQAKKVEAEVTESSAKKSKRRKTEIKEEDLIDEKPSPTKRQRKTKVKVEEREVNEDGEPAVKVVRKRKTKEEKEAEAMPLAARSNGLRMFIGAHVSCAKGVQNTVTNCVHIGGNAFAMFLKSQRKWENPPLQDEHKNLFISNCGDHKYDASSHVLPHGSYLVNLAQEDVEKATQAYDVFLDDLHRCEALGIKLYNFHPGSTGSHPRPSAIARIAKALNRAHLATKTVTPVLETMAAGGNIIGSTFEDLRDIIALIDDKKRIGVCLDTCHVFAAGYDLRSPDAFKKTLESFDKIVGMKYLCALHLNDSKAPFDSHRDLHQNIGLGFLGLRAFHNVMNEPRFEGLPMVLETPIDHKDPETGKDVEDKGVWAREIKLLEGLIGADTETEEFKTMEKDLADKGTEERKKLQEQYDKKVEKDRKALEKGQTKLPFGKRKKKHGSEGESDSEGR